MRPGFTSLNTLESFQHEIGCRILRLPEFYSKSAVRIALHWPSVATCVLIRKLGFLSKLLSMTEDTISHGVFTSLAMENVFGISLVQQCQMLEANLGTCVLASCLSGPDNTWDIVRSNKKHILNSDFKMLLSSANHHRGSAAAATQIGKTYLMVPSMGHRTGSRGQGHLSHPGNFQGTVSPTFMLPVLPV